MHRPWPCLLALAGLAGASEPANLVDGAFANGWKLDKGCAVVQGVLHVDGPATCRLAAPLAIAPEWKAIHLAVRMRASGFVAGDQGWNNVRVACAFIMPDGSKRYAVSADLRCDAADWQQLMVDQAIPAGAVSEEVVVGNMGKAGSADFTALELVPRTR